MNRISQTLVGSQLLLSLFIIGEARAMEIPKFETLDQAVRKDPFVAELIGETKLKAFLADQARLLGTEQSNATVQTANETFSELQAVVEAMTDDFTEHRWFDPIDDGIATSRIPFDAEKFLIAIESFEQTKTGNLNKADVEAFYRRVERRLNQDRKLYQLGQYIRQLKAANTPENRKNVARIVEADFFAVPFGLKSVLTGKSLQHYKDYHQEVHKLYLNNVGGDGGKIGDGSGFEEMLGDARESAGKWADEQMSDNNSGLSAEAIQFKKDFYVEKIVPAMYNAAKRRMVSLSSAAKNNSNGVASGLKYAKIYSDKAEKAAKEGDNANAVEYAKQSQESAEKAVAAMESLSVTVDEMKKLHDYMVPYVAIRTGIEDIDRMEIGKLSEMRDSMKKNYEKQRIDDLLGPKESIAVASRYLEEARTQTKQASKLVAKSMEVGKPAKLSNDTFDTTSREAFDTSKDKLTESLEPQDYQVFVQQWVKMLQAAIAEDPYVMADDKKYMAFVRKHFENKTPLEIIGKE